MSFAARWLSSHRPGIVAHHGEDQETRKELINPTEPRPIDFLAIGRRVQLRGGEIDTSFGNWPNCSIFHKDKTVQYDDGQAPAQTATSSGADKTKNGTGYEEDVQPFAACNTAAELMQGAHEIILIT